MEQDDNTVQLIIRYLQDDVQDYEQKIVENWIKGSESNRTYFEDIKKVWDTSETVADFSKIDVDKQWDKFKSKTVKKTKSNKIYLKIAASIVLLISLGYYINASFNTTITLVAKAGAENKFVLPDNSEIWLKQGSELKYEKEFKGSARNVSLNGEGFFEVTKDPNKPFIVLTGNTTTKVLGTSFNLKNDLKTKQTELVLLSGKVEFLSNNDKQILVPGDKVVAMSNGKLVKSINKNLNFSSWKSGILKFEKTPIHQVIKDIELHYNKKITIKNQEFANCTLTTIFDNEPFDNVMQTLKILFDFTYVNIDKDTIVIKGGDCNS